MTDTPTIPCNVRMTRVSTSGVTEDVMRLEVTDMMSGVQFLQVDLSAAQVFDLMSNLSAFGAGRVQGLELIGSRIEVKEETIKVGGIRTRAEIRANADALLAPYEKDGWMGRRDDLYNHHRAVGDGMQRVTFTRHVDAKTGEPVG